jgi:hypothetical protein
LYADGTKYRFFGCSSTDQPDRLRMRAENSVFFTSSSTSDLSANPAVFREIARSAASDRRTSRKQGTALLDTVKPAWGLLP